MPEQQVSRMLQAQTLLHDACWTSVTKHLAIQQAKVECSTGHTVEVPPVK